MKLGLFFYRDTCREIRDGSEERIRFFRDSELRYGEIRDSDTNRQISAMRLGFPRPIRIRFSGGEREHEALRFGIALKSV